MGQAPCARRPKRRWPAVTNISSSLVLRSIELNLDTQGAGDMDVRNLKKLDIVLAAFHEKMDPVGKMLAG